MNSPRLKLIFLIFTILCNYTYSQVYVKQDANGTNDGTSWQNAYNDLDFAINNTSTGEIWVAKGVYKPSTDYSGIFPGDPRECSFNFKQNIGIYGGFAGDETNLNERDYINNITVMSGDIGNEYDFTDNCYHVIYTSFFELNDYSFLDGITVTGGNNSCSSSDNKGGGICIYYTQGNPTYGSEQYDDVSPEPLNKGIETIQKLRKGIGNIFKRG